MAKKYKILIVEDDRALLKVLSDQLGREKKLEIISARDGQEALDIIKDDKPDLILLDLVMPRVDGLEVIQKVRADKHWGITVPIIVLTSLSDVETIGGVTEQNVHDFLVKTDWRVEDVVRKVKEKLGI